MAEMMQSAKWIMSGIEDSAAVYTFRHAFTPKKAVKKATICASAMGIYALYLNGERIGKGVLTPGFTAYLHRVQYQTYDVTAYIKEKTEIELGLGNGWAVGYIGFRGNRQVFAKQPAVIASLEVFYEDGTTEIVGTDADWDVYSAHVTFSDIYNGETVDMTVPIQYIGKAQIADVKTELVPQVGEWITEQERLSPVEMIVTPKGERVLDFGQNMTGYVELRIHARKGSRIVLHHGEVLDRDGNFYNANLRSAQNEITYICSGGEDVFKPTYSFQGFRYVHLVEYPFESVRTEDFCAVVVHSEMNRTGYFRCGNEKINQLYHNILWGQKSNFLDIPTDCPQRDERLGWTGDAQVFCRTAAINYDVEVFFKKWLEDMALEQGEDGAVMGIVPDCLFTSPSRISAAWGDASCIVPWEMYSAYGDSELLRTNFPMMKKWVNYIRGVGPEEYLWLTGMHYGDWLAMDAGEDSYVGATSNDLIATAFYAYSTELTVRAGEVLGEDMTEYRALHKNIVKAFRAYFMENGMPKEELPYTEKVTKNHSPVDTIRRGVTQTAITLILRFGLCEDHERAALASRLVELIKEGGMRMSTGFVGTPYLLHVLSDNGFTDVAYELLFQEKNPSWLYSVCHGATTMWEHWNGIKEDGSFWSTDMNSFNHYAYGSVFDWIFGVSCGIQPAKPGYREVRIAPQPDPRLGFVDAVIHTRNGVIRMHWYYKEDGRVFYELEIPMNVKAQLVLPSGKQTVLNGGRYHFAE